MLKEYIKTILETYNFNNIEFSPDLVEIILDKILEGKELIEYKNILIKSFPAYEGYEVEIHRKPQDITIRIIPPLSQIGNTNRKGFRKHFYSKFKNWIYFYELDRMFKEFASKYKLKTGLGGVWSNTQEYEHLSIHTSGVDIEFYSYRLYNEHFVPTRIKNSPNFRNPNLIMQEVEETMKEYLKRDPYENY